jgi:hypothetical protein
MFKHTLTHDVAYESLLRQRRRALHSRVGEVIEELYSDRLAEFYETPAWHYMRAEVWGRLRTTTPGPAAKLGAISRSRSAPRHNVLRTAPAEVAGLIREFVGLGGPSVCGG